MAVPAQEMRPRSGCCLLQHVVLAQGKIAKKNAQLRAPRPTLRVLAGIPSTSRRKNREEKRANGGPKAHAERERERERECWQEFLVWRAEGASATADMNTVARCTPQGFDLMSTTHNTAIVAALGRVHAWTRNRTLSTLTRARTHRL